MLDKKKRANNENKCPVCNLPPTSEEERLRDEALLESMGEGIIATDAEGIITKINKATKKILGFSEKELVGKPFHEAVLSVDDRNNVLPKEKHFITRALKSKTTITDTVYYLTSKRRKFPARITISPVIVRGKLSGVIAVFRDITEELAVDKAKTEFVSLASHQLRTPLATIKWYTQMLGDGEAGTLNEEQRDYVREILESGKEMSTLINEFLNLSRIEMGTFSIEPEPINPKEVVESVLRELAPTIQKKHLRVEKKYENKIPEAKLDPKLFLLMAQNLLTNATKYTPSDGTVTITLAVRGKNLVFSVEDSGYGIPEEEQSQIFKKMFRASNAKHYDTEGTGLGLYMIKSLLETVGGSISFKSAQAWGTTFTVAIPLKSTKPKKGTKKLAQ